MATINGVTFNLKNLRIISGHRNEMTEQPGSDSNFINDMGYDGLTLRLEGYETSLSDYDAVITEFMRPGAQILVHRTGWQFSVYSAQLTPSLIEGYDDTHIPYDLILYTSTPYRESTNQQARNKIITTNNQEWSAEDTGYSLLHNWNFETWNDGTSSAPDYYTLYGSGATINRESSVVKKGTYSAQVNRSGTDCTLYQTLLYPKHYRDTTLTLGVWVYASTANRGRVVFQDDDGYSYSDYHTGAAGWEFLTVTRAFEDDITFVNIHLQNVNGDGSVYFDSAMLIKGSDDPDTTFTRDILTAGSVDAVPDIQIIGATTTSNVTQTTSDSSYPLSASDSGVTIAQLQVDATSVVTLDSTHAIGQTIRCRKAGMAIIDSIQFQSSVVSTGGDVTCTVYDSVGGSSLGSKAITISVAGTHTWTFDTPIATMVNLASCTDGDLDTEYNVYFKLTTSVADITFKVYDDSVLYAEGCVWQNDVHYILMDLYFNAVGHSCKEVQQTFEVAAACTARRVVLNLCKYQYAGTNSVTCILKQGATTLGTATAVLTGTAFYNVDFVFAEESTDSLNLATSTTYTLHITPPSDAGNATDVLLKTNMTSVYASGAVTLVEDGDTDRAHTHDIYFKLYGSRHVDTPQVYNMADTSVVCDVANTIMDGATHRINADGTGTVLFEAGFYTNQWDDTANSHYLCTHDTTDNELDIADDGYIYWYIDTKYPITGIPILNAQINNTAATLPTIQISTDASTWYDIDTAVVDDVLTEYPLDDDGNLSLKGRTSFYFRIDCATAAVTQGCSIKFFALKVDIITIDAEHPKITTGTTASTFTCDQNAASGLNCEIALIYRDRSWAV